MDFKIDKENQTENMINFTVNKSNDLIQKSRYTLTPREYKIIAYITAQIEPQDKDFKPYTFDIQNFCNICGINPKGAYTSLKKTILELSKKNFWYRNEETGEDVLLSWIVGARLSKEKGKMVITISPDMKPFLLNLKEKFTSFYYYNIALMDCQYSLRLFEILKSYQNLKEISFTVEEFKKIIDADYSEYKELKRRCILPALEEINKYTDIRTELQEEKKGRKVIKLKFSISKGKVPFYFMDRETKRDERMKKEE